MINKNIDEGLKRVIGVPGLAATIVNNTIGSGIYVLPAIICIQLGAAGILAYVFCGAMLVSIMFCYAEIGSKISASGGSYIYVETAFGPFAGFIINWLFFFGWGVLGSAAMINVIADSLAVMFPVFLNPLVRALLFFILLGFLILLNVRSVKLSVRMVEYITILKLIPLLGIVIFGLSHIKMANLHWEYMPPAKTFGKSILVLFWAFAGFETSLSSSGEIKQPGRTIPLGILLSASIVFTMYVLIQTITQGVLGAQVTEFKNAPLAAVAERIVGPAGITILLIAAIISCFGNTSGDILASPRLLFAGAKDGLFPKPLAKVHPRFATPYVAIIVYSSLIFIVAVSGGFQQLAILASCALLIIYLGVILAMIKLRRTNEQGVENAFKAPGGLIIPLVAIAAIIWLLSHLSGKEIISTIIFIAVICAIYFIMELTKNKNVGSDKISPF